MRGSGLAVGFWGRQLDLFWLLLDSALALQGHALFFVQIWSPFFIRLKIPTPGHILQPRPYIKLMCSHTDIGSSIPIHTLTIPGTHNNIFPNFFTKLKFMSIFICFTRLPALELFPPFQDLSQSAIFYWFYFSGGLSTCTIEEVQEFS